MQAPAPVVQMFPQEVSFQIVGFTPLDAEEGDDAIPMIEIRFETAGFLNVVRMPFDAAAQVAESIPKAIAAFNDAAAAAEGGRRESGLIVPPSSEVQAAEKAKIDRKKGKAS